MSVTPEQLVLPKQGRVQQAGTYGFERIVAIGDVHGCFVELGALLKQVDVKPTDILVFLADLVDRGPASGEVVRFARGLCETRPGSYCVLGNHDEKQVRARRHFMKKLADPAYKVPMRMNGPYLEVNQQLTDEDCAWLAGLPAVLEIEPFVPSDRYPSILFTHAGVHPRSGVNMPQSGLIRLCWLDKDTLQPIAHNPQAHYQPGENGSANMGPPNANAAHWSELYQGASRVVYGHAVLSKTDPVVRNNTYGVDTGACYGGRLTAYVEDLKTGAVTFEQVQVETNYALSWQERGREAE